VPGRPLFAFLALNYQLDDKNDLPTARLPNNSCRAGNTDCIQRTVALPDPKRVLLLGRDDTLRMTRAQVLRAAGYEVMTADTQEQAAISYSAQVVDAVLICAENEQQALEHCERIRAVNPEQLVIVIAEPNCYIPPESCPDRVVDGDPHEMLTGIDSALKKMPFDPKAT